MKKQHSCLPPGSNSLRRRRAHSPTTWTKIKPSVEYYYVDLDMTLGDTMQRISNEHNFRATEQMFKKQLKKWSMSKQVKTSDKEKALARILQNDLVPDDRVQIRHDKLVRYAKSRVKCGALDTGQLRRIIEHNTAGGAAASRAATVAPSIPRSPALPNEFAGLDVFLRAMQAIIEKERGEYSAKDQASTDAIFGALRKGLSLWRGNALAAARESFCQAARKTMEDLRKVSVTRIAYCISSILWGSDREAVFRKFTEFMVKAAMEVLGPLSPLTVALEYITKEPSVDAQVRIWACALDDYHVSEENFDHWWNMAKRRWQWCWRSQKLDLAIRYCRHAMSQARKMKQFTSDMEAGAQRDLDAMEFEILC